MDYYDDYLHMMERQGGSFARALAHCWYAADPTNKAILTHAFAHIFDGYKERFQNWQKSMDSQP